jgi:hypothetical protein
MKEWCKPADIIAVITIIGGLVLMLTNRCNQTCNMILLAIVAFYFGLKSEIKVG